MQFRAFGLLIIFYSVFSFHFAVQHLFDTPTSLTSEKGAMQFNPIFNDDGDTRLSLHLSINTSLTLGLLLQVDRLIGQEKPQFYIPGIKAKIRFTDNPTESWNIAFGYDLNQYGSLYERPNPTSTNNVSWTSIYGVYTKGFFFLTSAPHLLSIGVKFPVYPSADGENFTLFTSFIFQVSDFFYFAVEVDNLKPFDSEYIYYLNENNILSFQLVENLKLMLIWQVALAKSDEEDNNDRIWIDNRSVKIMYETFF